ncbi:MAG: helicase HerA-like domain-containing protein [Bacteroidota bacterium]
MGIGEAFVSVVNEKGIPTTLVHTRLRGKQSRMDFLNDGEIKDILDQSSHQSGCPFETAAPATWYEPAV